MIMKKTKVSESNLKNTPPRWIPIQMENRWLGHTSTPTGT